jgi:hypothetical protein
MKGVRRRMASLQADLVVQRSEVRAAARLQARPRKRCRRVSGGALRPRPGTPDGEG